MDPFLIEFAVNHFLSSVKEGVLKKLRRGPVFELLTETGTRVLIEVKGSLPSRDSLERLARMVNEYGEKADRFLLVTPALPSLELAAVFAALFSDGALDAKWIGLNDIPDELGIPTPGDLSNPKTLAKLQLETLVSNVGRYIDGPVGPHIDEPEGKEDLVDLVPLAGQFSHRTIATLIGLPGSVETQLRLGEKIESVSVVLSDLINFSSLINASQPDELKESMSRYYRLARDAIFSHHGMLDKFIGDAVLAVFGYPVAGEDDSANALRFARELLDIGTAVLTDWQRGLNAHIETGTRIGIATGDLWPINIGSDSVEVALLGDTISLAARLERRSPPDNVLIDNRTKTKAEKENVELVKGMGLVQLLVTPGEAKGQQFITRAWHMRDRVKP